MHINELMFIVSARHDIFYQASQFVPNKKKQTILNTIKELYKTYDNNSFKITKFIVTMNYTMDSKHLALTKLES